MAYIYFVTKHPWSLFLNGSWSEDSHPFHEVISKFDITKELAETELDNLSKILKDKGYHEVQDGIFKGIVQLNRNIAELWAQGWTTEYDQREASSVPEGNFKRGEKVSSKDEQIKSD